MSDKKRISFIKKTVAVIRHKCPACHEGEFFTSKNPFYFKDLGKYHPNCPKCGQRLSLEPGFYFGAAYVSYGLNVALFVAVIIAVKVLLKEPGLSTYISAIIISTIILAPIMYRLSRVIWATLFIPYGGENKE